MGTLYSGQYGWACLAIRRSREAGLLAPQYLRASAFRQLFFVYAAQFLRPPLCGNLPCHCPSSRTEHLLIHRIQSHTHPKRRKFCLKHAGRKSVKEELPERRKGPKRAIECRLKVPTHVWDRIPRHSNPTRRSKRYQTGLKSIEKQQKVAVFLYPFSPFRVIPNTEIFRR